MKSDMENKDWLNQYMSLKQVNPANPFIVPDGYFDSLADNIASRKNIEELKGDGISAGFTVPANYFEELASNIQSRIAIEGVLNNREDSGFAVPEGYFDNLQEQIKSRVVVEEALSGADEGFAVPAGYFNQLTGNILDKTVNQQSPAKRGIVRRMFASTAFKYATAACFALCIGAGILLTELSSPADAHKNSFLHKQLASVPVDEIKSYLQLNVDAGDTQQTVASGGTTVNDKDLKQALQNEADSVQ